MSSRTLQFLFHMPGPPTQSSGVWFALKGKCIDFSSMVQKKDNLISVRMAYLSLPYDKPNLPNRQLYTHVAIATSAVMTYERLSSTTEKVDHCRIWSFSIGLLYSRSERRAVFNAVSAANCLLVVLSVVYWDMTPIGESWSAETPADKRK